jgi:hypothetical protein
MRYFPMIVAAGLLGAGLVAGSGAAHSAMPRLTGKWVMGVPIHPSPRALSLAACQA